MSDLYGWIEDQQEARRESFYRLLHHERSIWTPASLFSRCCVKWLAQGDFSVGGDGEDEYGYDDDEIRGCSGCHRDHPTMTVRYKGTRNNTTSNGKDSPTVEIQISHRLDPFLDFLDSEGAAPTNSTHGANHVYHVEGFMRECLAKLRTHPDVGYHLVTFDDSDLALSDEEQKVRLDRDEGATTQRANKKCRLNPPVVVDDDILEEALEICRTNGLEKHLDPVDIACFRLASKTTGKVAARMAQSRMQQVTLFCEFKMDGIRMEGDSLMNYDDERIEFDEGFDEECPTGVVYSNSNDKLTLCLDTTTSATEQIAATEAACSSTHQKFELFRPTADESGMEISWDSSTLNTNDKRHPGHKHGRYEEDYWGHKIILFVAPMASDYGSADGPIFRSPCEASSCCLSPEDDEQCSAGHHTENLDPGMDIGYEVLSKHITRSKTNDQHNSSSNKRPWVRYKGVFRITQCTFTFANLVSIYAREKILQVRREHERIGKSRPLTRSEEAYFRLLENAISYEPF